MKKNYKLVLGLVAGLTIGSAVGLTAQPTTTEAKIKYETPKQAGQRWYKAQTKAYNGKKKVSLTFNIKAKNEKQADATIRKLYVEAAKAQYGNQFINRNMTDGTTDYLYTAESFKKIKKGVYRWKITINGKSGTFRREYRETEVNRKLLADLTPLTKGKNQFDKAFITMAWLRGRAGYQCGRNQDTSKKALWKRKYHTDCDGLAGSYWYYAEAAGVKKVGMVSTKVHSFNYIVVNGRMYFVDFQRWNDISFGRKGDLSGKEFVEKMYDPDYVTKEWYDLKFVYDWYKKNVDPNAKKEITPKAILDEMTKEQRKAFDKYDGEDSVSWGNYALECDSWSQAQFLPMKVYCSKYSDYTVKKIKKIVPKKLHKYLW